MALSILTHFLFQDLSCGKEARQAQVEQRGRRLKVPGLSQPNCTRGWAGLCLLASGAAPHWLKATGPLLPAACPAPAAHPCSPACLAWTAPQQLTELSRGQALDPQTGTGDEALGLGPTSFVEHGMETMQWGSAGPACSAGPPSRWGRGDLFRSSTGSSGQCLHCPRSWIHISLPDPQTQPH